MRSGGKMPEYWLSRDDEGNKVRVTGAMLKKGGSRKGTRRNWQKRWFVLDPTGGRLRYYEDAKLNSQAGTVLLLAETEVVVEEIPKFRGRHAPTFEGEDPYYVELRGTTDASGRPRPFAFAVRALSESEYLEWTRSLNYSVRLLKRREARKKAEAETACRRSLLRRSLRRTDELSVVTFATLELGLVLNLSRRVSNPGQTGGDSAGTAVVVEATRRDKGDGVAFVKLAAGDELVAILPPGASCTEDDDPLDIPGAHIISHDTTPDDFSAITQTLRDAPRPLSLVFKRRLGLSPGGGGAQTVPASGKGDAEAQDVLLDDVDLDDDAANFFCSRRDAPGLDSFDTKTLADMKTDWQKGTLGPDSNVFLADAWVPISRVPALLAKLQLPSSPSSS